MKSPEERIVDRDKAISDSRWILMNPYYILDTETTGLVDAQMCQIALLYYDGTRFSSLVKPTIPIEEKASSVHHITDEDVAEAPTALEIVKKLPIFKLLVIYNVPFDLKVLEQSLLPYDLHYTKENNYEIHDAMQIYSAFKGDWDDYHGNYKWYKLGEACKNCGIPLDLDLHDALSDVIMTERLIKYIAVQKLSTEHYVDATPQE